MDNSIRLNMYMNVYNKNKHKIQPTQLHLTYIMIFMLLLIASNLFCTNLALINSVQCFKVNRVIHLSMLVYFNGKVIFVEIFWGIE